jgi:ABC-type lipoprotein release transport system permease subunit
LLLRKAFRDLSQRKFRTFLTVIGLAIAVVCVTGFSIISNSILESAKIEYGINSADAFLQTEKTNWNEQFLANQSAVSDYELTYLHYSSVTVNSKLETFYLRGIESERLEDQSSLAGVFLEKGRLPNGNHDEILVDVSCAKALDLEINDEIEYAIINSNDEVENLNLKIVGLARCLYMGSYTFAKGLQAWMDLSQLYDLLDKSDEITGLYIKYFEGVDIEKETEKLYDDLIAQNIEVIQKASFSLEDDWRYWLLKILNLVLLMISVVSFIIGGILTVNTIHMAIASEKKNIALTKIIGATKRDILVTYLLEAVFFGIAGAIIGMTLSLVGSYFLIKWAMIPFNISTFVFKVTPLPIILGISMPIITSVLFALIPIRSAMKIPPMEALRDNVAKDTSLKKKDNSKFVHIRYSLNNLFRNKARLVLNVIMISLAIGLVVSTTSSRISYLQGIDDYFGNQPVDIFLYLQSPAEISEVTAVIDNYTSNYYPNEISEIHYLRAEGIEFNAGNMEQPSSTALIGILETDSILDQFTLKEGRYFTPADVNTSNIILTHLIAKDLKKEGFPVNVGSTIELQSGLVNKSVTVIGIVDDLSEGGKHFYIPISTMNNLYNCSTKVNRIFIQLEDSSLTEEVATHMSSHDQILARGWSVQSCLGLKEILVDQMNFTISIFLVIIILGSLIAIFGGFNSFTMAAMERQKEIALLKLIGSRPRWIVSSFLIEGLFIGLLASIFGIFAVGVPIGIVLVNILSENLLFCNFIFSWSDVLIGFSLGAVLGFISAVYPGYKASKTSVVSALQYE